jgi:hypothetical protein
MNSRQRSALAGTCTILAAGVWSARASAQETTTVATTTPAPVQSETTQEQTIPSRMILGSGIFTFGVSYGAGVVVAATSSRPEDHHLYVPLAGPWIDLGDRGACGGLTGRSCDTETTYKVLLAVDGVFQALGALAIIDAFLTPETHTVTRTASAAQDKPRVRVAPGGIGTGYGMVAVGSF